MTDVISNVKIVRRIRAWIDRRPRTGWYITALLALNYVIDAMQSLL